MIQANEIIEIGVITRTHGNRGEVQAHMFNDCWENADATFLILRLDDIPVPFRVTDWRCKGSEDILFTLQGIRSETEAASLVSTPLYMLRRDVGAEQQEMLTWQDLIGFEVQDTEAGRLGIVSQIDDSTLNTLLILDDGRLIPAHEDLITRLDAQQRTIYLSLPQGL